MAGIFIIHPRFGTDVTCTIDDTGASGLTNYVVYSVDWNETEREEVVYGEDSAYAGVSNVINRLVPATIRIAVLSTSYEGIATNLRTLMNAFRNPQGGTIEYRPRAFGTTIRRTFYHYLRSGPPVKVSGDLPAFDLNQGNLLAELYEFKVQIKPWATSDPASPVTLLGATTIQNRYQSGSAVNYVTISAATIIGDVAFPIVTITRTDSSGDPVGVCIMNARSFETVENHSEWHEGESLTGSGSTQSVAGTSGGQVRRIIGNGTLAMDFGTRRLDSSYLGKAVLVVGLTADVNTLFNITNSLGGATQLGWTPNSKYIACHDGIVISAPVDVPTIVVPKSAVEADIDNIFDAGSLILNFGNASDPIDLDWVALMKADQWLATMHSLDTASASNLAQNARLIIDTFSGRLHNTNSSGTIQSTWNKKGSPLFDLILPKKNTTLNFIFGVSPDSNGDATVYNPANTFSITITGFHGTIYPFSTV